LFGKGLLDVPLNIAGKQTSNGTLAVAGGLIVGLVSAFLPWHSTTIPTVLGSTTSGSHNAFGYWSGWLFVLAVLTGIALFAVRNYVPDISIPALPFTDSMIYLGIGVVMLLCALLWLATGGGYGSVYAYASDFPGYSSGPSFGVFIGVLAGVAVGAGGYLVQSEPQPATKPLSVYQTRPSPSDPPPAMPPPAPPAPSS